MEVINEYYKAVLIGSSSTGKTSFINRLDNKGFSKFGKITLGTDITNCKTKIDEIDVNISIWDTAGQEKFSSLTPSYFKNCHAAFIFYDVNDQNSFDQVKSWNRQIEQSTDNPIVKLLIASKCDSATRLVDSITGKNQAISIGAAYLEISSKDNVGIKEALHKMAYELTTNNNKMIVIGAAAAGKSSFIQRIASGDFHSPGFATTGVDRSRIKTATDNKTVNVVLWDTAGSNRFLSIIRPFYEKSHGVFIVYNANDLGSFKEVDNRNKDLDETSKSSPVKVLIAAQCDLPKEVDTNMGKAKADSIGAAYFETSSKKNTGVKEAFDYMVKETNKKFRNRPQSITFITFESPPPSKEKSCCFFS